MKQLTTAAFLLVVALLLMLSVNVQAGGGKKQCNRNGAERSNHVAFRGFDTRTDGRPEHVKLRP